MKWKTRPSDIELPQSPSIDDDDATEPDKGGFDLDDTKAKMPPGRGPFLICPPSRAWRLQDGPDGAG